MNRLFTCLMLALALSYSSAAQQVTVTVTDKESGLPLEGAILHVRTGTDSIGQTDASGTVMFSPASFPITIAVSAMGYEEATAKLRTARQQVRLELVRKLNFLQETVVTGVPQPVKLQNALSLYRVINKATMQAQGATTLADALTTQLNINLGNDNILGANIQMQGLRGDKVKILIDGMPVNGREGGNIDPGQLNLNNIERVEVVQGPMSVAYGSDALGGVINLITKKNSKPWEAGAGFLYESIGKYNADVSLGYKWKGRNQVLLSGGRNFFAGWGALDTLDPARRLLFKTKEQYFANASYKYTAPSGFGLLLASDFLKEKVTDKGSVAGWPFSAIATDGYYRTTRFNNRLQLNGRIGRKGLWSLQNGYASYGRIRETVVKDLVTMTETLSSAKGDQDTSHFDDISLRSNYSNHTGKLRYDGGYDVLLQYARSQKFGGGEDHSMADYAAYGNAAVSFLKDKMTAQVGLRASHNDQFRAPLIPSLNLMYTPVERVQLRASYARGFRAPSLKEMYLEFIDYNHHIIGNPDLKAEEGHNLQASASWQYKGKGAWTGQLVLTGYYNNVSNQIVLADPNPSSSGSINRVYANMTQLRNYILNLQTDITWKELYLTVGGGAIHTFAADSSDKYTSYEGTANARYFWRGPRVGFSLFYKYTGRVRNLVVIPDGAAAYDGVLPAYHMLDASLERRFWHGKVQLVAGVKNIFDVRTIALTGAASGGAHGGEGGTNFLPRHFFSSLRLSLH